MAKTAKKKVFKATPATSRRTKGDTVKTIAEATDGGGDALVVVSLYPDDRVELRVLRGGPSPLYGIFALRHTDD